MRTVNEQDGRMTPGDVPATSSWPSYIGRTAKRTRDGCWWGYVDGKGWGPFVTHAEAVEWVRNCPLYVARCGASSGLVRLPPIYTADLSTWCVRYIWEPRHVRGFTDGAPAIVPLGFDPSIYGKDQGCRKAVLGRTGWWLYRADGGFGCCVPTEAQAIAWVEDGVLT
jgi:hypothetical protein